LGGGAHIAAGGEHEVVLLNLGEFSGFAEAGDVFINPP